MLDSVVFYPDGNSQGNTMENSGKQNPESGFKSPPSRGEKSADQKKTKVLADFCAIFEPTLTSILGAKFGIEPDAWAGSGAQPAKPYP
jgi:hypothetical protein